MKFTLNWLKRHMEICANSLDIMEEALLNCGIEIENRQYINPIFNVFINKVEQKPGITVKICEVQITETQRKLINYSSTTIQILTTADVEPHKNIALAPLGTTINGLLIQERTIKNHISQGMFIIDEPFNMIAPNADILAWDDIVYDISVPANRWDLMNVRGIARQIAGFCGLTLKPLELGHVDESTEFTKIKIENSLNIPISFGQVKDITVKSEIINLMKNIGKKSNHDLQTLNDFVIIDCGTPMHIYDESIGHSIILKEYGPNIGIFNDQELICICGIKGIKGFLPDSKNVIIEAALPPKKYMEYVEKDGKLLPSSYPGIETDASKLNNLGVDSEIPTIAYIYGLCEGKFGPIQYSGELSIKNSVDLPVDLFYKLSGITLSMEKICEILEKASIKCKVILKKSPTGMNDLYHIECAIPSHRSDLNIPEDIVEELLIGIKIHNYKFSNSIWSLNEYMEYNDKYEVARDFLISRGLDEVYSIPFVKNGELKINNPINEERPYMRSNLIYGLQDKAQSLWGMNYKDIRLFEIGTIYPSETIKLGILFSGKQMKTWNNEEIYNTDVLLRTLIKDLETLLNISYKIEILPYDDEYNNLKNTVYGEIEIHSIKKKDYSVKRKMNYDSVVIILNNNENINSIIENISNCRLVDKYTKDDKTSYSLVLMGTFEEIAHSKELLKEYINS